jgi:hypothetical protein
MTTPRASIFDTEPEDGLDVSGFAPKKGPDPAAPTPEQVKVIAEAASFPSRQAGNGNTASPPRRKPRIHRTGRTMQLNARTTPETVAAFYGIADAQGWLVGETLERNG